MSKRQSINLFFYTILIAVFIIMHYCKKQVCERWLFNINQAFFQPYHGEKKTPFRRRDDVRFLLDQHA